MCLVKSIAVVLVVGVIALGALYYLQSPSGTWVVDRDAMHEEGGDSILSRIADGILPDLEIEMAEDGTVSFREGSDELFTGTWKLEDGKVLFGNCPLEDAEYGRPDRLTIVVFDRTIIFKRQ